MCSLQEKLWSELGACCNLLYKELTFTNTKKKAESSQHGDETNIKGLLKDKVTTLLIDLT